MTALYLVLYIFGFVCFVAATFVVSARVNLIALGLAFWILVSIITTVQQV